MLQLEGSYQFPWIINHRSNYRIKKIGCYHITLYWLSSQVEDKQTWTANIRHKVNHRLLGSPTDYTIEANDNNNSLLNTAYNFHRTVLSNEQLFSKSQKVLRWNLILTKDSYGSGWPSYKRTRNGELSLFFVWLFGLKNVSFKNEWLPFSDPYYPTWKRIANAFHLLNRVLWSVHEP